jgi:hypothetical protein
MWVIAIGVHGPYLPHRVLAPTKSEENSFSNFHYEISLGCLSRAVWETRKRIAVFAVMSWYDVKEWRRRKGELKCALSQKNHD